MADYGVTTQGFNRKPLAVILRELEDLNISEFGEGIIHTPQCPMGQINGMTAEILFDVWGIGLDLFQMFDTDNAEGTWLRGFAKLTGIDTDNLTDDEIRKAIKSRGQRDDPIFTIVNKIKGVDGVESVYAYVNDTSQVDAYSLDPATVSFCVIGGDDYAVAEVIANNIDGGISTYGNRTVSFERDGYARGVTFIRPNVIDVSLNLSIRKTKAVDFPNEGSLKEFIASEWVATRRNGVLPDWLFVRKKVEPSYDGIEVYATTVETEIGNQNFGFFDIGNVTRDTITVEFTNG